MTRNPLVFTLVAAGALAACDNSDHTIVAGPGADETKVDANANVELPPAIAASKSYRCHDNTLVYVDWLSDNKSANVRTEQSGKPTQVQAAEAGKPMTAPGGYEVSGSAAAGAVNIAVPGHPSQSCKG